MDLGFAGIRVACFQSDRVIMRSARERATHSGERRWRFCPLQAVMCRSIGDRAWVSLRGYQTMQKSARANLAGHPCFYVIAHPFHEWLCPSAN
jgi:hypothetical protein